ncbi:manganese efflux pump MntP [Caproiciproducens sp. LBM24188]|nr:manganese efflux pump [Oscillospiraceae bacterium]HHV31729.1 manganese efflux pump [Clostridiales bacterium]
MDSVSLCGIAVGLAMDAFAVSITNGAITKKVTPLFALKIAVCFGFFQALMPMIGWAVGKAGEQIICTVDHWIALILLGFLGIQMIVESRKKAGCGEFHGKQNDIHFKRLIALAVATSIDALVTGVILPTAVGASTIPLLLASILVIGLITFVICFIGVYIGKTFGIFCSSKAEIFGGIVLIGIGLKIFIEHMFFD